MIASSGEAVHPVCAPTDPPARPDRRHHGSAVLAIPNVAPATAHDARERGITAPKAGLVDLLDACAGHLRLVVVASHLVFFATMVAGRGRSAVAVAAVLGPAVDDVAETNAVTLRRAGAPGARSARPGVQHHDGGVTWGIDDRRELERACAAHVVDTPDQLGQLVLGS